jgi:hypothetical protein
MHHLVGVSIELGVSTSKNIYECFDALQNGMLPDMYAI